jgi:cobalt-zinc-cadmium efflux system outer membrane protein
VFNKLCLSAAASLLLTHAGLAAEPLTLPEALHRAAQSHPDLQGFAAERAGHDAQRTLARRLPGADASLLLEDALGSGERAGLDSAQWTLSFAQALEIFGQPSARLALADAKGHALLASQSARERVALAEVAQRFIEAAADAERRKLAHAQIGIAQKALDAARARVEAARAPVAERARAQAELAKARLELEHAEHEELSARVALAVSMGRAEPDFGELRAQFFSLPELRSLDELRGLLAQSPAARARLAQAAVHDAERRAAMASGRLRPTITAGVRRYEDQGDTGAVLGVSVPLGAGLRARDEAAIAAARGLQSDAENRAAALRAKEQLFDRYQELRHAREALRLLGTEVLPAMDEALEQTQYAYDRGRYGYLELSQILRERAVAHRERLDTAARYHALLVDLELLVGANLIDRSTP